MQGKPSRECTKEALLARIEVLSSATNSSSLFGRSSDSLTSSLAGVIVVAMMGGWFVACGGGGQEPHERTSTTVTPTSSTSTTTPDPDIVLSSTQRTAFLLIARAIEDNKRDAVKSLPAEYAVALKELEEAVRSRPDSQGALSAAIRAGDFVIGMSQFDLASDFLAVAMGHIKSSPRLVAEWRKCGNRVDACTSRDLKCADSMIECALDLEVKLPRTVSDVLARQALCKRLIDEPWCQEMINPPKAQPSKAPHR